VPPWPNRLDHRNLRKYRQPPMLLELLVAPLFAASLLQTENENYGVKLPPIQVSVGEWTSNKKPYLFRVTKYDPNPKTKGHASKDRRFVQCEVEFVSNIDRPTYGTFGLSTFTLYDEKNVPYPASATGSTIPDGRHYIPLEPTQIVNYLIGFEIPKDAKPGKLCYQHGWQRTIFVDLTTKVALPGKTPTPSARILKAASTPRPSATEGKK